MEEVVGFLAMTVHFLSFTKAGFKIEHSFTNTVHSWQVVALPLKSQLSGSFSMALGDIIHVLGRPRCGLCRVWKNAQFLHSLLQVYTLYLYVSNNSTWNSKKKKINWVVRSTVIVDITSLIHILKENPVWSKILKGSASTSNGLEPPHLWNCSQYSVNTIHACLNVEPPIHRTASKV